MTKQLDEPKSSPPFPSRRHFLRATATTGMVAGLGTRALAQETERIELGGETAGWEGRSPEAIEGETNPTLELEVGQTYEVTWENLDGLPHDFVILDEDGQDVVGTEITDEEGETLSLEFEASEEMAEYYCSVHPQTMRGNIRLDEGGEEEEEEEDEGDESAEDGDAEDVVVEGPTIGLERVADGFTAPTGLEVAPGEEDEGRYYVLDQVGQIYVVDENGRNDEPFLDLGDQLVDVGEDGDFDERGLLGLAFHPEYDENRRLFVYYSADRREGTPEDYDHTGVLAEFEADEDGEGVDLDSERTILEVPEPQFNHNGGPVLFGPDGYLYWALGDGGDAADTGAGHVDNWYDGSESGNGQNTTENFLGAILRLDVDGEPEDDRPYAIPDDNPFADGGEQEGDGLDEYYAWGFRNPWRAAFDGDGRFFVADVGQFLFEEVDVVERGGNYGWNVKEGIECFSTETPDDPPEACPDHTPDDVRGGEALLDPIIHYPQRVGDDVLGISVVGGYAYEGEAVSELEGMYVFGDWSEAFETPLGSLFASPIEEYEPVAGRSEDDLWEIQRLSVDGGVDGELGRFVLSFGRDHDDELYVLTTARYTDGETGEVFRLVPAGEGESIEEPDGSIADDADGTGDDDGEDGGDEDEDADEGEDGDPENGTAEDD